MLKLHCIRVYLPGLTKVRISLRKDGKKFIKCWEKFDNWVLWSQTGVQSFQYLCLIGFGYSSTVIVAQLDIFRLRVLPQLFQKGCRLNTCEHCALHHCRTEWHLLGNPNPKNIDGELLSFFLRLYASQLGLIGMEFTCYREGCRIDPALILLLLIWSGEFFMFWVIHLLNALSRAYCDQNVIL